MLVYVREAAWEEVMKPIGEGDIPRGLVERFKKEKEEAEKKAREMPAERLLECDNSLTAVYVEDLGEEGREGEVKEEEKVAETKEEEGGKEEEGLMRSGGKKKRGENESEVEEAQPEPAGEFKQWKS
eukprot:evm.model.NODE_10704_length_28734_cov_20.048550.3